MKDEAVSPIIAFMLLLMVVVSFISVLNAYYIPSLKQQAEIEHLHKVEEAFIRISPDVFQILAHRQNLSMNEPVQMGGGDVIFSPLKSSGYLEVNTSLQADHLYSVSISHTSYSETSSILRSRITYRPVGNFWINQGCDWEDGIVNISKGNHRTYLQYGDDDVQPANDRNSYYEMLLPRISTTEVQNNLTSLKIDLVNIEYLQGNKTINGNGIGTIWVGLKESSTNITSLNTSDILSFSLSGKAEEFQVPSTIREALNRTIPWSNAHWNPSQLQLSIPDDATIHPEIKITVWNLSMYIR